MGLNEVDRCMCRSKSKRYRQLESFYKKMSEHKLNRDEMKVTIIARLLLRQQNDSHFRPIDNYRRVDIVFIEDMQLIWRRHD